MRIIKSSPVAVIIAVLLIAGFNSESESQVIGRGMDVNAVELGFAIRWFKRDIKPGFTEPVPWDTRVFYLRYGLTNWLTLLLEGNLSLQKHTSSRFPNRDYRDLLFGGSVTVTVLSLDDFNVLTALHYSEILNFDRSAERHHKQIQSVLVGMGIQRGFTFSQLEITITASSVFAYDELSDYTLYGNETSKSVENFGASVGLDAIAFNHAHFFSHLVYANFWQPRVGIGYVF